MMASLSFDQVIEKIHEPLVDRLPPLAVYVKGRSDPQKAELRVADQQGWLSLRFDLELLPAEVDVDPPEEIAVINNIVAVIRNRRVVAVRVVPGQQA
jgi:hypothetical protein